MYVCMYINISYCIYYLYNNLSPYFTPTAGAIACIVLLVIVIVTVIVIVLVLVTVTVLVKTCIYIYIYTYIVHSFVRSMLTCCHMLP